MLKEVKEGQWFRCQTKEERNRIREKLKLHAYPVFAGEDLEEDFGRYPHIVFDEQGEFVFCSAKFKGLTGTIDEIEFFGENEWTPKAGEWVEISNNERIWIKRQYLCTINGIHLCVFNDEDYNLCSEFGEWAYIRQIPLETMTRQEAQEKLSELLNKPNLIIVP